MQKNLKNLGLEINPITGNIFYAENFKPLQLSPQIVYVRHGETYGNCGQITAEGIIDQQLVTAGIKNTDKCVFQGNVDEDINQLTVFGQWQALTAAKHLEDKLLRFGWKPDVVFHSPLNRAKATGLPFVKRNNLEDRYVAHPAVREMSFGELENKRICDLPPDNPCHLLYLTQNALIKFPPDLVRNINEGESFVEVIFRAHQFLLELDETHAGKKILIFSHSIFGAACAILFGKGQKVLDSHFLAFDGKAHNGKSYNLPHAVPFPMNF